MSTNEVATRTASTGMGLISRDALKQSLGNITRAMPVVATGGIDFLNMNKRGDWSYGQDGTELSSDSLWAVNPGSLQHGWIAWAVKLGLAPLAEIMVSAMKPLPDKDGLTPVKEGKGYIQQYSVELICIAGPDEGAHVLYKNTTVGALKLFNGYIDELWNRVESDAEELVAVVQITSESYDHKEFGETWNPIFDYVEWRTPDDVSPPEVPVKEEPKAAEAKPKATRKPKAAAAPAPEPEPEEQDEEEDDAPDTDTDVDGGDDDDGDDDLDAQIAALAAKKAAKKAAELADAGLVREPVTEAATDTVRRRTRR